MTLLMQHIVETGRTRLAAMMPAARPTALRIQPMPLQVEPAARARASALYAGQESLNPDEFLDLSWLECFARSGRQLLMGHALGLLAGWLRVRQRPPGLQRAAERLARLAQAAGSFAAQLEPDTLDTVSAALQLQIAQLMRIKPSSAMEALQKATTLLDTARIVPEGNLTREAAQLLEQALPQLIAGDGSPAHHALGDYIDWVTPLLAADDLPYAPALRGALDRVGPFLSMLLGADHTYAVDCGSKPLPLIHATAPLKFAPEARVGRLAAGRAVVIALPQQLAGQTSLAISSHDHILFKAEALLPAGAHDATILDMGVDHTAQGQLLQLRMPQAQRAVFLSPKGDDLRVEDMVLQAASKSTLQLAIGTGTKVSVARNGMQASIAVDGRNLWQLSLRGGHILPPQQDGLLVVETRTSHINWALKRVARTVGRNLRTEPPELPF
jgi:hypothetical protein